jgi:hypothetical protein
MKYFETLPKVVLTQPNGTSSVFTNLLSRVSVVNDLLSNPLLFYSYDIQEGDTPEIVADKYYGDSYRYWLVLISNNIMDPQWEWPLTGSAFNDYIAKKYTNVNPYNTVHHYEKVITQFESTSKLTTTNIINIDQKTYNSLQNTTHSYTFPSGTTTVTTTGRAVSFYDYELQQNESKRNIKLVRRDYATKLEQNLKKLMS